MTKQVIARWTLGSILAFLSFGIQAVNITGAGASFPYPVYAKWAAMYYQATGKQVNYQSIGSGGGQQQIIAETVDFGATDDPMAYEQLVQHHLVQFPAVIGGTVPVVNVKGVQPGDLKLSGTVLADIYLGKITRWNDTAIQALNEGLDLPNEIIVVVHRSDGSGTTFGWTNYLSKVSSDWKNTVGEGKAVKWPTGQGGKGNEGVAAYVRQLNNTIGYVEYAYAQQNNLAWVQLQNQAGNFSSPSQHSFAAAAENVDWLNTPGMGAVLTDQPGENSWPLTAASFILLNEEQARPQRGRAVLDFFDWVFDHGGDTAIAMSYVPLPAAVVEQIEQSWATDIATTKGEAIWEVKNNDIK